MMNTAVQIPSYGLTPVLPHAGFIESRASQLLRELRGDSLDADVGIWEDFLRDYLWLVVRSRHDGRENLTCSPLEEFRVLAQSPTGAAHLIGEVIERDTAEHVMYWHSGLWC